MIKIGQEWLMDWFNTKQGRRISPPGFGDKLTVADVIVKKRPVNQKVKNKPIKENNFIKTLKKKGFTYTYVEYKGCRCKKYEGLIDLGILRAKSGFVSVYYGDKIEKNFSKIYRTNQ